MNGSFSQVMHVALRRKKRVLVAALCAASFVTGHVLFGEEAQPKQSRISEYLQAKVRLASGADDEKLTPAKTQASPATSSRRAGSSGDAATSAGDKSASSPAPDDFGQALQRAVVGGKPADSARVEPVEVVAHPLPLENKSADDENLPPIIPASAMPRPRPKGPQVIVPAQPSTATARSPAPSATVPSKTQTPKPSPWRINLGGKLLPSISAGEQETPQPPSQAPAKPQSPPSSAAPPSPTDRWNFQPNSTAAQAGGAVQNPFASQKLWGGQPQAESGMPRTLFPTQVPPANPTGVAQPAAPEITAAPRPYPMPLEIINPNVSRRPVVPAGTTEPVRTATAAPPVITAQPAAAPAESNPLRATYHEPGLLAAPTSTLAAEKENPASNLKRIEAAMGGTSEGGEAKPKSSRRRYMLDK